MTMTAALRDRLKAAPSISALVGDRVYRIVRPQGSDLPAVSFQKISEPRTYGYEGAQRLQWARVQFDCWADSQGAAEALAETVTGTLEPSALVGQIEIARAFVDGSRDLGEQDVGRFIHRVSVDLIVWWKELGFILLEDGGRLLLEDNSRLLEDA